MNEYQWLLGLDGHYDLYERKPEVDRKMLEKDLALWTVRARFAQRMKHFFYNIPESKRFYLYDLFGSREHGKHIRHQPDRWCVIWFNVQIKVGIRAEKIRKQLETMNG